jgi:hypothetical protein
MHDLEQVIEYLLDSVSPLVKEKQEYQSCRFLLTCGKCVIASNKDGFSERSDEMNNKKTEGRDEEDPFLAWTD